MSVLDIITYPNKNLSAKSRLIDIDNENEMEEVRILAADMLETIEAHPDAVGLSAVQVGRHLQLIVIRAIEGIIEEPLYLINPTITQFVGKKALQMDEGCLSVPGIFTMIKRSPAIVIKAHKLDGSDFEIQATGVMSIIIQHELDHLIGKTILDKVGILDRIKLKSQYEKQQEMNNG